MKLLVFYLIVVSSVKTVTSQNNSTVESLSRCPERCFCNKKLTSVNCEGQKFLDIPDNLPQSVVKLYMDHNLLTSLRTHAFGNLPHLEVVYLRSNKLGLIHANAFAGLPSLQDVYLTANVITDIDANAFAGAPKVGYLNLGGNSLRDIPRLAQMTNLQILVLEANQISNATFPEEYSRIPNLLDIVLSNNNITVLTNATFAALKQSATRKLELSRNKIDNIAPSAFSPLNHIQSLKLGTNPLTASALHLALGGLQGRTLASLDISHLNLGGSLPASTFALLVNNTLNNLIMKYNQIHELPNKGFAELEHLITLDLSHCGILKTNNLSFAGLKSLTVLTANYNLMPSVPQNLPPTLQKLYLSSNQINSLENSAFSHLGSLQELYLGNNIIQTLNEKAFADLANLRKLHLESNKIATLPGQIFARCVRLRSLELSKNHIKQIPDEPDVFTPMQALEYLNLADNMCTSMPLTIFSQLQSLIYLHLENNQLGTLIKNDLTGKLFLGLGKLQELYLDNNAVSELPDPSLRNMAYLHRLLLHGNHISDWGPNLFKSCSKLQEVDLSNNYIALVNNTSLQDLKSLTTLNLKGNPFACTCDLRWFRDWMKNTTVNLPDVEKYTCNLPRDWKGKSLLSFDKSKIDCVVYTKYMIIGGTLGGSFLVLIVGIFVYRQRWFIRLRLYRIKTAARGKVRRRGYEAVPGNDVMYDAYVLHEEDDIGWITKYLLPGLDNGTGTQGELYEGEFKMFLDERDGLGGKSKMANFIDNIEASRKVLVVLTKNFVTTDWLDFQLDMALFMFVEHIVEEIIIIKVGVINPKNIPKSLRPRMEKRQFLEWEDDQDAMRVFKERLQKHIEDHPQRQNIDV